MADALVGLSFPRLIKPPAPIAEPSRINEAHVAEPGLAVIEVAAAEELPRVQQILRPSTCSLRRSSWLSRSSAARARPRISIAGLAHPRPLRPPSLAYIDASSPKQLY
ncbi:DUF6207 family protein [Streptomyces brasiliensis]|uniref:DUF6207 family protein n=1 Tax=Streptomyces brasiliensis TaxID=1954 RepID=UPI003570FE73